MANKVHKPKISDHFFSDEMSAPMTRKRARDEKIAAENKKSNAKNTVESNSTSLVNLDVDEVRKSFFQKLLGPSQVADESVYAELLSNFQFPAQCPITLDLGIRSNDLFVLNGNAMSRTALQTWVSSFKNKTTMPTCPKTRAIISDNDLIDLGFSLTDFKAHGQRNDEVAIDITTASSIFVVNLSDEESLFLATDEQFCMAVISELFAGNFREGLTTKIVERIKRSKYCVNWLAVELFFVNNFVGLPLWNVLVSIESLFDWSECIKSLCTERHRILAVEQPILDVFEKWLPSRTSNATIYALIDACFTVGLRYAADFKEVFRSIVEIICRTLDNNSDISATLVSKLLCCCLEFRVPLGNVVKNFYLVLRRQSDRSALIDVWRTVAKTDCLDQSAFLVAYHCSLPRDMFFEVVRLAVEHHSNKFASAYYEQLLDDAERFFCLKSAIEFSNSVFLGNHCLDFVKTASIPHNNNYLMARAAENGDIDVVKTVFKGQRVNMELWTTMLASIPEVHFSSFRYIWLLGAPTYASSISTPQFIDCLEDPLMTLCRNGDCQKLEFWLRQSPATVLERYYRTLLLGCCTSLRSHAVFKLLVNMCKEHIQGFDIFFNNGILIVRAATCGAHHILDDIFSKIRSKSDLSLLSYHIFLDDAMILAAKHSKRKAFFILWRFVNKYDWVTFMVNTRARFQEALSVCQDDFIKEVLQNYISSRNERN